MVEDVTAAINAVLSSPEVAAAGGDPRLVYVWGQSAGAHLAACAIVERAVCETLEIRVAAEAEAGEGLAGPQHSSQQSLVSASGSMRGSSVSLVRLVHSGADSSQAYDYPAGPSTSAAAADAEELTRGDPQGLPASSETEDGPQQHAVRFDDGGCGSPLRISRAELAVAAAITCGGDDSTGLAAAEGRVGCAHVTVDGGANSGGTGSPKLLRRRRLDFPASLVAPEVGEVPRSDAAGTAQLAYEELTLLQPHPRPLCGDTVSLDTPIPTPAPRRPAACAWNGPTRNPLPARIRRFFGVSGTYDVGAIAASFQVSLGFASELCVHALAWPYPPYGAGQGRRPGIVHFIHV